ncbi:NB-ARC domain-containing protein [Leptothoe sp. EHU-05/26/07-4]
MARYALVIGISEYESKHHLKPLPKAIDDAEAIATVLRQHGQCEQVNVLSGKVSKKAIETALATLVTQKAAKNEVFIYFTGHGVAVKSGLGITKGYLTTSDCQVTLDNGEPSEVSQAIEFSDLNELIRSSDLSNLVMLIDACHSGEFIERTLMKGSFSAFNDKQDYFLVTACRGYEKAWVKTRDDHSVFTGAVLEVLVPANADADGRLTGDRLFSELSRALRESRQEPVRFGKGRALPIVQFSAEVMSTVAASLDAEHVARLARPSRVPLQMPPLPDHFVERPDHQQAVLQQLLCEETKVGTLVVSAIYGLGGIGKSVLASKLAHEDVVQTRFADGILWVTLGQNPDILPLLSGWIQALGDNDYKPTAIQSASNHLRTLLYDKRTLLVVDDVWNPQHLDPFRVGGDGCCVLVTTREVRIPEAHRYALDVMTADQALELMTQKLSEPLSPADRERALEFSKRVGFLPLALELAASQIEEGVSWSELLGDLHAEVVRLETLDFYGQDEIPDDAKRRKYSLLACFNLSLKQLSLEQLRQFAWLGVIPEDVNLTQEMAETLWQVTSRQSGSILRTFRAKALVLQGIKQANGQLSYRMHDLMHDLAGRLLMSPPQPIREGELPGLGLTKAEAHHELLSRYRAKTSNGQWYTLKDDGYIYAHLTWHMEQAKQPKEIHRLLRISNEQGRNGWYEACDAIGKPAGFVNDLGRAWQLAIDAYDQEPSQSVALVFRYALIRTSLNSLASNVPAELVGALVEKGVWQVAQGLAYAQQAQNPWHRAACISAVVPHMPKALLPEVLKTIGQINDAVYRSYVLSKLAERFLEVWPDVLKTIQQIQDRYGDQRRQTQGFWYRAFALRHIAKLLPRQYLPEAIEITCQIQDAADRASALIKLAQQTVELWPEALEVTRQIQDESYRSFALSAMAQHLPELWPEALEVTRQIQDEDSQSRALSAMAQHLPELWPEALEMTRQIQAEDSRARALRAMAQHLPEALWPEALEMTRQIQAEDSRARALRAMAQHLPELWPEALEVTRQIQHEPSRARALRAMAQHLPEPLWPEVLEVVRQIQDEDSRSWALSEMAEHLPELWPEALEVARQIQHEPSRSSVLSEMAEHLPEPLWPEVLEVTRQIQHEDSRSSALSEMAEHLPEPLLPEVLEMTRQIQDEDSRARALRAMAEHLPELWPEALEVTRQIQAEDSRARALREMAEHLPELWPEALEVTRQIQDEDSRSWALSDMTEYLPEPLWPEVLEVTRQIQHEPSRARALRAMAQHLPEPLWPEVLEVVRQIQDESYRSWALSEMAEHLPELWPEALEVTRQIQAEDSRARALRTMAEHLPEPLWPEALEVARQIQDEDSRARALSEMAEHLPELWPEALEVTRQIQDEDSRSWALRTMAEHLPEPLWPEALEVTRQIQDEDSRARALSAMAEHLPELWPEALEVTRQIQDEDSRSWALSDMTEYLPEPLWPEVLDLARQIQDEDSRARALRAMAEYHLPKSRWSEALDIVWSIKDKYYCANALQGFLSYLEPLSKSFTQWTDVIDILAYQKRAQLLNALPKIRPMIISFGKEQAFSETLQAVREVCRQWP